MADPKLKESFCTAANALTQLFMQSQQHSKKEYDRGVSAAMEMVATWATANSSGNTVDLTALLAFVREHEGPAESSGSGVEQCSTTASSANSNASNPFPLSSPGHSLFREASHAPSSASSDSGRATASCGNSPFVFGGGRDSYQHHLDSCCSDLQSTRVSATPIRSTSSRSSAPPAPAEGVYHFGVHLRGAADITGEMEKKRILPPDIGFKDRLSPAKTRRTT